MISIRWKLAPKLASIAAACLGLLIAPCLGEANSYWFETYELTRNLIDSGRFEEAAPLLRDLIQTHPVPAVSLRVPGDRFVSYLPYYHRAMILLHQGKLREASHTLDICEAFGAVLRDRRAAEGFLDLRRRIAKLREPEDLDSASPGGRGK